MLAGEGFPRTFIKAKLSRLPINLLVEVVLNASLKIRLILSHNRTLYPQKYHWNEVTQYAMTQTRIKDKADFLRARPA